VSTRLSMDTKTQKKTRGMVTNESHTLVRSDEHRKTGWPCGHVSRQRGWVGNGLRPNEPRCLRYVHNGHGTKTSVHRRGSPAPDLELRQRKVLTTADRDKETTQQISSEKKLYAETNPRKIKQTLDSKPSVRANSTLILPVIRPKDD